MDIIKSKIANEDNVYITLKTKMEDINNEYG